MNSKEFKKRFGEVAKANEFKNAFGCWYKESAASVVVLELRKSNFGDYYQLLIKIFIQGAFESTYAPSKDVMRSSLGHITANETPEYKNILDFDERMEDDIRRECLDKLFADHIVPFTDRALSRGGIMELANEGEVFILPAVKQELA